MNSSHQASGHAPLRPEARTRRARRPRPGLSGSKRLASLAVLAFLVSGCHTVTSVAPNPAVAGSQVSITGTGFGSNQGANQVIYDSAPAGIVSWSNTLIVATLPAPKANGTYTLSVIVSGHAVSVPHTIQNPVGMSFVPSGAFLMGSNAWPDQQPVHTVTLDAFWIDTSEVTVLDYGTCLSAGACTAPVSSGGPCNWGVAGRGLHPINCVHWNHAASYCAWAGKRLPTEAEWEKGARGTDARTYPWGETTPTCSQAVFNEGSGQGCGLGSTWPVGSKPLGDSPYGLHDMAGNAYEWVNDWYSATYYSVSPAANPSGPASGTEKVLRGGSWLFGADNLPTTIRPGFDPSLSDTDIGFRCARNG